MCHNIFFSVDRQILNLEKHLILPVLCPQRTSAVCKREWFPRTRDRHEVVGHMVFYYECWCSHSDFFLLALPTEVKNSSSTTCKCKTSPATGRNSSQSTVVFLSTNPKEIRTTTRLSTNLQKLSYERGMRRTWAAVVNKDFRNDCNLCTDTQESSMNCCQQVVSISFIWVPSTGQLLKRHLSCSSWFHHQHIHKLSCLYAL